MRNLAEYQSVYVTFLQSVDAFPDNLFLRVPAIAAKDYTDGAISFSYQQAAERVRELVAVYQANRITENDRVAIAFDSRIDVYLHLLAVNALGASIVPLNSSASDSEIRFVLEHSDSKLIVGANEYVDRLKIVGESLPVLADGDLTGKAGMEFTPVGSLKAEAALLYTSGTTGDPKGCMLSNEYFLALGVWYSELGGICTLDQGDRLMTPLPPNHMNALATSFMAMMMCGGCIIQLDRFHPSSWWQTARNEGATVIHCLGVMVAMLLTLPEQDSDDFSKQIRFCFGPGSDPRHQAAFEHRFGIPLVEAWAMTESGAGGITIANKEPRHVGERCIGKPVTSMEYRIVDEHDHTVTDGDAGQLLVRTKGSNPRALFFSGYYKDPAATDAAWQGGWFHTGDVVRVGPDGSLFFVDRLKNVIRRSGENIAAVEVEAVLLKHPQVSNCAVCPVPDEIRGDEVFAFVVSEADGSKLAQDLFDHCLQHLTYFKVPGYITFVDALPLTASQKISRGEVKTQARDHVAAGNCTDLRHRKQRKQS